MSLPVHLAESLAGVAVGDVVEVTGDEAHHAVAVRRLRVGERLLLTDGAGAKRPESPPLASQLRYVCTSSSYVCDLRRAGPKRNRRNSFGIFSAWATGRVGRP